MAKKVSTRRKTLDILQVSACFVVHPDDREKYRAYLNEDDADCPEPLTRWISVSLMDYEMLFNYDCSQQIGWYVVVNESLTKEKATEIGCLLIRQAGDPSSWEPEVYELADVSHLEINATTAPAKKVNALFSNEFDPEHYLSLHTSLGELFTSEVLQWELMNEDLEKLGVIGFLTLV